MPTTDAAAITNGYDSVARLLKTALVNGSGGDLDSQAYLYNGAGQRQKQTLTDGSYTSYGYDDDGQLTSSLGYDSGGSPIAAQQLGFSHDAGWNLASRSVNGAATTYTVNDLNELTAGPDPAYTYDANGNLTSKGSALSLAYDDENRVAEIRSGTSYKADFTYDGLGRLRLKTGYAWNGSGWYVAVVERYLYDDMRCVQERDGNNNPTVAYTRGTDLSGSLEGAGGIGGLLARSSGYSGGSWSTHDYYHADGGGNVTYVVNSTLGSVANYQYFPYGGLISGSDSIGNVYRFSSKRVHANSGLYYYGYRFYDPSVQRWPNRDPIEEEGGLNLYEFVANNPINWTDPYGLALYPPNFVGPLQPGDSRIPYPPSNVPGGPWTWSPNPQNSRGDDFIGPKQPTGPRTRCTYSPSGPNNPKPYWKTTDQNGSQQRYNENGEPITPDEAHPGPTPTTEPTTEPTPTEPTTPDTIEPDFPELPDFPFFDIGL